MFDNHTSGYYSLVLAQFYDALNSFKNMQVNFYILIHYIDVWLRKKWLLHIVQPLTFDHRKHLIDFNIT